MALHDFPWKSRNGRSGVNPSKLRDVNNPFSVKPNTWIDEKGSSTRSSSYGADLLQLSFQGTSK
jgi:hypothetical protein